MAESTSRSARAPGRDPTPAAPDARAAAGPLKSEIVEADFFEDVGYSTVWEDERIVDEGLAPRPGERVLSISSGGDFTLQFLLHDAAEVVSIDFNPRQTWLLQLKVAALERLELDEVWELLGLIPSARRGPLYGRVRGALPADARRYWDDRPDAIGRGFLRCGRQDRYIHLIGRLLRLLQGERTVRGLFECADDASQRDYFASHWNRRRWRALSAVLFNRRALDFFFDKDHFRYARDDQHPATAFRRQAERVLRDVPAADNFYLHWLFFGTYADRVRCPAWLAAERSCVVRARLDRLDVRTAQLEQTIVGLPDDHVDCFNFSNIFDWVSPESFLAILREVVRVARPGARLCYWTNIVNTRRELSEVSAALPAVREERARADALFARSRTPGYSSCTLGRIEK